MYIALKKELESVVYADPEVLYQMYMELPGLDTVVYSLYVVRSNLYPAHKTGIVTMFDKKTLYILKVIELEKKPSLWKRLVEWVKSIIRG